MKSLGLWIFTFTLVAPATAGQVFKMRGKLKSYSDKDFTLTQKDGSRVKIPLNRLLNKTTDDLSKLLGKDVELDVGSSLSPDVSEVSPTSP
jgi:hypothetical protein